MDVQVVRGLELGHRHRLDDAGGLNQQVVETALTRELRNLLEKVLTERAADTAVAHLHQPLLHTVEMSATISNQLSVDVDLRHVVDDDGDTLSFTIRQHVIEERGLARSEKSGENRDGEPVVSGARNRSSGHTRHAKRERISFAER